MLQGTEQWLQSPFERSFPVDTVLHSQIPSHLYQRFLRTGTRQGWLLTRDPILVAVSGGGDSVALTALLLATVPSQRLILAHAEHGLRGKASEEDAHFVASFGSRFALQTEVAALDVPHHLAPGEGIEAGARRLRLHFLETIAKKYDCPWIATGHTADDLAETVLFHALRGTGTWGCAGIREVRLPYVRPVLDFSREELRNLLQATGLPWQEDASNDSLAFTRNRLRHKILPLVERAVHPGASRHLAALGREIASREAQEEYRCSRLLPWVQRPFPLVRQAWDIDTVRALSDEDVIRLLRMEARIRNLNTLDRSRTHILIDLLRRSRYWRFQWQGSLELVAGGSLLAWMPRSLLLPNPPMAIPGEESWIWGPWNCRWEPLDFSRESQEPPQDNLETLVFRCPASSRVDRLISLVHMDPVKRKYFDLPKWCSGWWPVLESNTGLSVALQNGNRTVLSERVYDRMDRLLVFSPRKEFKHL